MSEDQSTVLSPSKSNGSVESTEEPAAAELKPERDPYKTKNRLDRVDLLQFKYDQEHAAHLRTDLLATQQKINQLEREIELLKNREVRVERDLNLFANEAQIRWVSMLQRYGLQNTEAQINTETGEIKRDGKEG